MRSHGVPLPAPNTSGVGPLFAAKGIDTSGHAFVLAARRCRAALTAASVRRGKGG